MIEDKFDSQLYSAGLTAQGCWDELDEYARDAIIKFGDIIIRDCISLIQQSSKHCQITTFDKSVVDCTKESAVQLIKQHFYPEGK
jgi:hypothetical protein